MGKEFKEIIAAEVAKRPTKEMSLAFRVKDIGDNLFAAEMCLLRGDTVVESRQGIATSLGHAAGSAGDLLDAWAVQEIETGPESFFRTVFL